MKAFQLMTKDPLTVTPEQSVADAVRIMKSQHCGIVPVVEPGENRIVGLVTDRDIALGSCDQGSAGPDTLVSAVMSTNLFCVDPDEDLSGIRLKMEQAGVRRIPVVEEEDRLVGIISFKDLADATNEEVVGRIDSSILSQEPNS